MVRKSLHLVFALRCPSVITGEEARQHLYFNSKWPAIMAVYLPGNAHKREHDLAK